MNNTKMSQNSGGLVISDEVIASIAMNAAKDIDGVSGFSTRAKNIQSLLKIREGDLKYVDVYSSDNDVKIQMHLNIKSGTKIPVVSAEVQKSVKNAVQSMTGKIVSKVDISIDSIAFDNEPEQSND